MIALLAAIWTLCIGLACWNVALRNRGHDKADHAKCIAHIASVTSHRIVAISFREAADKWDSIEEQANLRKLANERYSPGGPSMPAIWMRQQADLLDPLGDLSSDPVYNMAGERFL